MPGQRCLACGESIHPGDQFCGNCGTLVAGGLAGVGPTPKLVVDPDPPRRIGRRVLAGIATFLVVAGVSGLIVAFVDARNDAADERARLVDAQARIVELDGQVATAADPDAAVQAQLVTAQADLEEVRAELTQVQADLTAERDGRAADAATAQAQNSEAVAAVQTQLDAVQAQLTALQAVFPLDESTFRAAAPTGNYTVTIQPLQCTIVDCLQLQTLNLSFPDATKVSGNRANGIIAFANGSYSSTGSLATEQAPLCSGAATDATFELTFHATRVGFENGLLRATQMAGTYQETITTGDCVGQLRSYSVTMVGQ